AAGVAAGRARGGAVSALRDTAFRLLRIPGPPQPPAGEGGAVRVFRASRRFYQYGVVRWALRQAGTAAGIVFGLVMLRAVPDGAPLTVFRVMEWLAVAGFVVQLPFTFLLLRFDYDMRWYILTERSLRIREGILTVREKTITFANVQNMTIRQGPLQRLLRIHDLEVRTAGGGGEQKGKEGGGIGEPMHVGYFRGVDDAEEIRDAIRAGVRRHRDAGLGDPDDARVPLPAPEADGTAELADAARALLAEARALRGAAAGRV
ncbi:MAG TPA: PH domain-containing protein, partial [Longimicrobiaceae bacterium]|nr:PH domain-containing protein [Longimicrobiaceae bacterium]